MFLRRDRVAVAASYTFFADISPLLKLHDYSDDRSFGYSDSKGDIPYTHLSVASEANDDVAMVTEECPS
jgi:hypothetical protein